MQERIEQFQDFGFPFFYARFVGARLGQQGGTQPAHLSEAAGEEHRIELRNLTRLAAINDLQQLRVE